MLATMADEEKELRERATAQLREKRDFHTHLLTYLGVNAFLVVIWAISGADFFWPVFPLVGWGLFGIIPHAWSVYGQSEPSEEQIRREMDRLRGDGGDRGRQGEA